MQVESRFDLFFLCAYGANQSTLPAMANETTPERKYDVALSYASEQADYVGKVADLLRAEKVNVFHDKGEQARLWGADLAAHFDQVFRLDSKFAVVFVSKEYAAKIWPKHEFKSALAAAVERAGTYLLPVRFDDTDLPGLATTVGYVNAQTVAPSELTKLILERLGRTTQPKVAAASAFGATDFRLPSLQPDNFNPYAEAETMFVGLQEELKRRLPALSASGFTTHTSVREGRFRLRVLRHGVIAYALDMWIGTMGSSDGRGLTFCSGWREISDPNSFTASGSIVWDRDRGMPVIDLYDLSLLTHLGELKHFTTEALADAIWTSLVDALNYK